MYAEPTRPDKPDYYTDLEVSQDADKSQIKSAFKRLAFLHHPDKRAPGQCEDAIEFRRARKAYEILIDDVGKATYDATYLGVQNQWKKYHRDLKKWENRMRAERLREEAETLARQKAVEEEERRKAFREAEYSRNEEAKRARQATEDYATRRDRFANWASEEAERRKQEAKQQEEDARWAREQEDMEKLRKAAKEREEKAEKLRKNVEEWARKRNGGGGQGQQQRAREHTTWDHGSWCPCDTCWWERYDEPLYTEEEIKQWEEEARQNAEEAAKRAHEEHERKVKEHLEKERVAKQKKQEQEKKVQDRKKAAKTRAAEARTQEAARKCFEEQQNQAKLRLAKAHIKKQQQLYLAAHATSVGEVTVAIDLGWVKKKRIEKCLFCGDEIKYYFFECPEGEAVACNLCKNNLSRYTLPSPEAVEEDSILQDLTNAVLEEGGDEK